MDIHRCRFVHYPPSTINALAFSHSYIEENQQTAPTRLALGRANGDIEIWNPLKGSWLQEVIIRGGEGRSIDGLVWTQDPNEEVQGQTIIGKSRLFSIGYTTTVTEWDLQKGQPLRHASGNHGEIWCLAAQPSLKPEEVKEGQWAGQHLIAGCTDGALVLYSTKDDDLQLQKVLIRPSSKKARIISVTFKDRNIVVAGCSDSTIRIYDIRNGVQLRSMSLGSGPAGGPKEIIIWSVKSLKDGTIISGDSTGELKIWDGETFTLRQRIKGHRQDVLSLATSADGSTIITGGMDRRTVVYKQIGKGKTRWAEVSHKRYHKHDVKSMASFESKDMSIAVSGGPDAAPIVLPLSQFGFENQRALPFLPQEPVVQSSAKRRLVMSWWDREVHIWKLGKFSKSATESGEEEPAVRDRKMVAKILIKGESNITSASLSADGDLLAVSTSDDLKIFQLRNKKAEEGIRVCKVELPSSISSAGARLVQFAPNGKWISVIRQDSEVVVARVVVTESESGQSTAALLPQLSKLRRIDRGVEKIVLLGGLGSYDRTITQSAFSSDSRILAVSDLAGHIDTFVLAGEEDVTLGVPHSEGNSSSDFSDSDSDSGDEEEVMPKNPRQIYGQHWLRNPSALSIPRLPSTATVLSFRPGHTPQKPVTNGSSPHATRNNPHPISHALPTSATSPDHLLVVTACSNVFEFNVLSGSLTPWSRQNPTSVFPDEFRRTRDQARGCVWDITSKRSRVWLYGVAWLWMFDLNLDFPLPKEEAPKSILAKGTSEEVAATNGNKRKRKFSTTTESATSHQKLQAGKDLHNGAGSMIPDSELRTGISRKLQLLANDEKTKKREQVIYKSPFDEMDIDTYVQGPTALEVLRRGSAAGQARNEGGNVSWHTFKYRPILGIVSLGSHEDEGAGGLEVAVVERPIWEVDLPPRYYGDHEREGAENSI